MLSTTTRAAEVISAFAESVLSRVPKRSRCAGPIEVMTATSGWSQPTKRRDLTRAVGTHLGHEHFGPRHEMLVDRARRARRGC